MAAIAGCPLSPAWRIGICRRRYGSGSTKKISCNVQNVLDCVMHLVYMSRQPGSEGRLPRGDPEGGARRGVLRRRLATAPREARDPARQALGPGREELALRIRRQCRKLKRGPRPKIATVERREARVPRWGREAPRKRLACRVTSTPGCPAGHPASLGAPPPLVGWRREGIKPRAQRVAGTRRCEWRGAVARMSVNEM